MKHIPPYNYCENKNTHRLTVHLVRHSVYTPEHYPTRVLANSQL